MFGTCSRCISRRGLWAASQHNPLPRVASVRIPRHTQPSRSLHVLYTIDQVRQARLAMEDTHTGSDPFTLGLVPTMGALHDGHIDLVRASQKKNTKTVSHTTNTDTTSNRTHHHYLHPSDTRCLSPPPVTCAWQLVSIFVNPTQFLPGEDLAAYPRPLQDDLALLTQHKVDYAFVPQPSEMYASPPFPPHAVYVDLVTANGTEEGKLRPHHFRGVATVCTKLFNIVQPHDAYFGQKDGMQCVLLQRMVRELNMPLHVQVIATSRERDGLARSSRNIYLTPQDRAVAPALWKSLQEGQRAWDTGVVDVDELKRRVRAVLEREGGGGLAVQYVSVMSWLSGDELQGRMGETAGTLHAGGVGVGSGERGVEVAHNMPHSQVLLSVAAKVGKTRLIDNILLGPKVREAKEYVS